MNKDMKKNYIAPAVEVVKIDTVQMLADSIGKGSGTIDPGSSWSNDRRGDWGDIWAQ